MKALKIWAILPILLVLGACTHVQYATSFVTDQLCTAEGQTTRLVFRTTNDLDFRAQDKAICARCPGEEALSCTGDPVALPAQ